MYLFHGPIQWFPPLPSVGHHVALVVEVTSGTIWCQLLGRTVAVEQLQGRQSPGLCPFANRGLTGSWNDCLTTAAAGFHAVVEHSPWNLRLCEMKKQEVSEARSLSFPSIALSIAILGE